MTKKTNEEVTALSAAMRWLACIEEEEPTDAWDIALRRALHIYIAELKFRLGVCHPYADDLCRLHQLKDGMRSLDPVYDHLGELSNGAVMLDEELRMFADFLGSMAFDMGLAVNTVESQFPQWAEAFAAERLMYAEWQAENGPLAGSEWFSEQCGPEGQETKSNA